MNGKYFIGFDLAMEVSVACVLNNEGNVVQRSRLATDEGTIRSFLAGVPRPCHFVVEESTQADWVWRIASQVCDTAIRCKPFKQGLLSGEEKDDDKDAYNLARKLRLSETVEVWQDADLRRKDLMQYNLTHQALVKESTRAKNRISAIFRAEGIKGAKDAYVAATREAAIAKLSLEGQRQRVRIYGEMLDKTTELRKKIWSAFYKEVKKHVLYKRLLEVPAFGKVSAAQATAIIWQPSRFKDKAHFWGYSGLALRTDTSSQYKVDKKTGKIVEKHRKFVLGLTKEHHRPLKCIIKRATQTLRRRAWSHEFQRLRSQGVSEQNATVTLARKLAALVLHFAKHGGTYDETKVFVARHS